MHGVDLAGVVRVAAATAATQDVISIRSSANPGNPEHFYSVISPQEKHHYPIHWASLESTQHIIDQLFHAHNGSAKVPPAYWLQGPSP